MSSKTEKPYVLFGYAASRKMMPAYECWRTPEGFRINDNIRCLRWLLEWENPDEIPENLEANDCVDYYEKWQNINYFAYRWGCHVLSNML